MRTTVSVFVAALFVGLAIADVINVPAGGSINSALSNAQENDEIVLSEGVYNETVWLLDGLPNGVTLRGASEAAWKNTILLGGVRINITSAAPERFTMKWLSLYGNSDIRKQVFVLSWIMGPISSKPSSGIRDFTMEKVYVYGNLGGPGDRNQMGVSFNGFSGTLTIRGCEFQHVGWGVMDTGSGSTYSSAGIFTHIQFEHNYVHECYGGTNFRCNSDSYCSLTIYNNTWEDISSTYSDTQWPLKGFEAFHVATINVTANHFRRIDRGAIGHGGSMKGMAFEIFNIDHLIAIGNTVEDAAQGFSIRCPATDLDCTGPTLKIRENSFKKIIFYMLNVSSPAIRNNEVDLALNAWDPDSHGSGPRIGDLVVPHPGVQNLVLNSIFPWLTSDDPNSIARNCSTSCGNGACDYATGFCYCTNNAVDPPQCTTFPLSPSEIVGSPGEGTNGFAVGLIIVLTLIIIVAVSAIVFMAYRYGKLKAQHSTGPKPTNYGTNN